MSRIKEADRELQRRLVRNEIIRRGEDEDAYLTYVEAIFVHHYKKAFRRTWWDPLMAKALMDVFWGVRDMLLVELPPRHGKTERGVRQFASYAQGIDPTIKFQYSTYGASLSSVTSSETKEIMESAIYREIFPEVEFSNKLNLKEHWLLKRGGGFLGSSIGGANTGMGADIAIPDDLLKAVDADSEAKRNEAWNFFKSSVLTRLEGRKAVIMIMQRLHKDDPIGRAEKEMKLIQDGGDWEKISLPVINDYDSFMGFYDWIERKSDDHRKWIDDETLESIKEHAKRYSEKDAEEFDLKFPKAKVNERIKYTIKREKVHFYKKAREVYLSFTDLPTDIVRYRDLEVERPPLTPLDEEEFGLDEIVKKRRTMGKSEFKKQMMQDVEQSEAGYFKKEHCREITDLEMPEQYRYIIVDPAESEESAADDRGVGVYGKSTDESEVVTTVLLDGRRGKWDVYGTSAKIIEMMVKFPDAKVLIEGAGGGISLGKVLAKEMLAYNAKAQAANKPQISNGVTVFKPDNQTSKNNRIKLISSPMEHGYFFTYVGCDGDFKQQFNKELKAFNPERKNNTDNCIDTAGLSYSRSECTPKKHVPRKPEPIRRRKKHGRGGKWNGI
jgi:hypothetical protein